MSNKNIIYRLGSEEDRMIEIYRAYDVESDYDIYSERSDEGIWFITIYNGGKAVVHAPLSGSDYVLVYTSNFRKAVREFLAGTNGIEGILKTLEINGDDIRRYNTLVFPRTRASHIIETRAALYVGRERIYIAIQNGKNTRYLVLEDKTVYVEYFPGMPPRKITSIAKLIGIKPERKIFYVKPCFPGEKCKRSATEVLNIIRTYTPNILIVYNNILNNKLEDIKEYIQKNSEDYPETETLTTTEAYEINKLIDLMKKANIADWKKLKIALAFALLLDEELETIYRYLEGRQPEKESIF